MNFGGWVGHPKRVSYWMKVQGQCQVNGSTLGIPFSLHSNRHTARVLRAAGRRLGPIWAVALRPGWGQIRLSVLTDRNPSRVRRGGFWNQESRLVGLRPVQ